MQCEQLSDLAGGQARLACKARDMRLSTVHQPARRRGLHMAHSLPCAHEQLCKDASLAPALS